MRIHDLRPPRGAKKKPKRIGCGLGSGHGKTSCKGVKGHKARSDGGVRPGFEGGQMPLVRRVPKRGFNNAQFATVYQIVNIDLLGNLEGVEFITPVVMAEHGFIKSAEAKVKVLGKGELQKAIKVKAHAFSGSARNKIEAAGGKVEVI